MKVGTTWTQEIIWTMKYNPNLDHPDQGLPILERSPFIDADMLFPKEVSPEVAQASMGFLRGFFKHCPGCDPNDGANLQFGAAIPEPRVLKSHLPLSLMPPTMLEEAKVVYVARDPRDVICSYYHHNRMFREGQFTGSLEQFCEAFMNDDVIYSPYWLHVKEAWEKRDHPNMHILLYENMKKDIVGELRKLDQFLGTNLTKEQLENVKRHTSFGEMQKRDNLFELEGEAKAALIDEEVTKKHGGFFRQGKTGDGKKRFSQEMLEKVDAWTRKHFDFGLDYN